MDEIRVNSDDWTGRDPARAAPKGVSPAFHVRMQKFCMFFGAIGLVYLGYTLAVMERWFDLVMPLNSVFLAWLGYNLQAWYKVEGAVEE